MDAHAQPWDVKLLYDGECPLCVREVRMMSWLNKKGRLALEDIAAPGFDAAHYGRTFEQLMGHIHAALPDGRLVTGMEAFRRSYAAVGLGALLAPTGWPLLRPLFDALYGWFAKNRLRLTGRGHVCENGRCAVPSAPVQTK
ncbi:MAG: thiol-disulfide oxidoreductase [Myxococcaceae bacterium]|nr:thiol-disulfide oxidoreductase [Myxococcaceae bacterium]